MLHIPLTFRRIIIKSATLRGEPPWIQGNVRCTLIETATRTRMQMMIICRWWRGTVGRGSGEPLSLLTGILFCLAKKRGVTYRVTGTLMLFSGLNRFSDLGRRAFPGGIRHRQKSADPSRTVCRRYPWAESFHFPEPCLVRKWAKFNPYDFACYY